MISRLSAIFVATTFLVGLSACGESTANTTPTSIASAQSTVITLSDMMITMGNTFKAGKYTFTITNTGKVAHELIGFRSAFAHDQYPLDATGAVNEEDPSITKVTDGDNLEPGTSQTREIDLSQPGKYVFMCNLPASADLQAHFAAGMYVDITVTA